MEKIRIKIRQIFSWCKKRKTLIAFLAVMLLLSASAAVVVYAKTAWPHGSNRYVTCNITGPSGSGYIKIKAYCNTWGKKEDKTEEVFMSKSREIALSNGGSSGGVYSPQLITTKASTTKQDKSKDGTYSIISFTIRWTIPKHERFSYYENDKGGIAGRFWLNQEQTKSNIYHSDKSYTCDETYVVNLSNFGMIKYENQRSSSTIHLTKDTVTVQYTNNYGGGWVNIGTKGCGDNLSGLPSSLERPFYRFTGWKNEHNAWCTPNSTLCKQVPYGWYRWIKAQWEDYYYNIDYNSNGSGQATQKKKIDRNEAKAELMDDIFSRPHYELTGWNTRADGKGTSYPLGGEVNHLTSTTGSTVTLYAQWRLLTHTVKFDGNGATSGKMDAQYIDEGDPQELRTNAFKRKGYYFCGWSTKKDGGAEYRDEETFTAAQNTGGQTTTLYAVWSRDGSFQVDNVTDDTSMFEGCDNLVGGNGTTYDYSHIDSKEANIDIPSDRGYFTAK